MLSPDPLSIDGEVSDSSSLKQAHFSFGGALVGCVQQPMKFALEQNSSANPASHLSPKLLRAICHAFALTVAR